MFDLSSGKITLQPTPRIKEAVLEIVSKHNNSLDEIQNDLNQLQENIYGVLGYNTTLAEDASKGATTIKVSNPEYATIGAKFKLDSDDTIYTIKDKNENILTIEPALTSNFVSGTELHILPKIDFEEIQKTFNAIEEIFNKEGSANDIFDALITLANAWNEDKKVIDSFEVNFNANGEVEIDLSAYNFTSTDDYTIAVSKNTRVPAHLVVEKIDEKSAKIYAIDLRYFAEDNVGYDGSCDGCSFPATILITYDRRKVHFTLTDLNNNIREI